MVMLFTFEHICNCEMIPKHVTCSLKNRWCSPGVLCRIHTKSTMAVVTKVGSTAP